MIVSVIMMMRMLMKLTIEANAIMMMVIINV